MPADYSSAAAALSLSSSPLPSPRPGEDDAPPWAARPRASTTSSRRLSRPYNVGRAASQRPLHARILAAVEAASLRAWAYFLRLPPLHRVAVAAALAAALALSAVFLAYSHRIFAALEPVAQGWRELRGGWVLVWLLTFAAAFPPMIGYSSSVTVAGFVYGFPLGWPIVASATVAGSTAAFLTSRGIFSGYVHSLVGADRRFVALGQVLRRDGLLVLTGVRFCPLPYSLSNGFLATIPSIRPWAFAVSTGLATPKLLVHIFIGSRLAKLAEEGDSMSAGDKAVNYISMAIGGLVGLVVGVLVYQRTMARAAELALEDAEDIAADTGSSSNVGAGYADDDEYDEAGDDARLMDPDAAAFAMDGDDVSLWGMDPFESDTGTGTGTGIGGYRDSQPDDPSPLSGGAGKYRDEEAAVQGKR